MSNSDENAGQEEDPEESKVDKRLSTLSLIARNVTLRLSSKTTSKRGNISKKSAGKTVPIESLENNKKVANVKKLNKIGNADLLLTTVDHLNLTKDTKATEIKNDRSENDCSVQLGKEIESSSKTETINSRTSFLIEHLDITKETFPGNSEQCPQASEVVKNQTENSDLPKHAEQTTHTCKHSPNTQTKIPRKSHSTEHVIIKKRSPKQSNKTQKCNSPKQTNTGQQSSAKPRVPFGTIRRRKSMKLGERSLVRRKSFLKKGDGLAARRQLTKQTKKYDTMGEQRSLNDNRTSLRMPGKNDKTNSTFLLTRNKLPNKASACEGSETGKSSSRSRRQWSENGVQTYEAMIFSSVFAFSEELRESSDIIHSKLQTLYNSTNRTKRNSVFSKKTSGLAKEWRQNNRELLNSGSQEIAGIFRNLRKVESNLKTVDQAVSILLKEKSKNKERISGSLKPKDSQIVQKGIK